MKNTLLTIFSVGFLFAADDQGLAAINKMVTDNVESYHPLLSSLDVTQYVTNEAEAPHSVITETLCALLHKWSDFTIPARWQSVGIVYFNGARWFDKGLVDLGKLIILRDSEKRNFVIHCYENRLENPGPKDEFSLREAREALRQ